MRSVLAFSPCVILGALIMCCAIPFFLSTPVEAQTRDQCRACCEKAGLDEYYMEQCKLKCYRDHNHCAAKMSTRPSAKASTRKPRSDSAVRAKKKPRVRQARRRKKRRPTEFKLPSPLQVTPGQEWIAAGLILEINGIPRSHPNHTRALQEMEAVLRNFAQTNPQGGRIPTDALVDIIGKYHR
ncbi:hypothetical protein ACFL2Q_05330 [Thermodesulfobacteriota bacterium]